MNTVLGKGPLMRDGSSSQPKQHVPGHPSSLDVNGYDEASSLVAAAQSVWSGGTSSVRITINVSHKLSLRMAQEGLSPLRYAFITDSDIRHIMRGHSEEEESRGQVSLRPADFGNLPGASC